MGRRRPESSVGRQRAKPPVSRVAVAGVPGLPDVELELGEVTALVGPQGSGKSQLLASVAWLLTGQPAIAPPEASPRVSGEPGANGGSRFARTTEAGLSFGGGARVARLPPCSFLRARDRLAPSDEAVGNVATRVSELAGHATSDAVAAEALVKAVEECCDERLSGEVLLIEEPEMLLTPQAQRYLYRLLRRFAEAGNQVLYSTRSPAFLDAAHHEEIVRLDLRHGQRSVRRTKPDVLSEAQRVRLAAEFDHERGEMFFARSVVLVEGQTERLALPFIFRAMGHDPDADGIAIVEVGGKSNLPLAARLLRDLAIPFIVVFDADRGEASRALDDEIRRAAGSAPVIRLEPDFEGVAGIASHTDKVLHAWQRFATAIPADVPPALAGIVRSAHAPLT